MWAVYIPPIRFADDGAPALKRAGNCTSLPYNSRMFAVTLTLMLTEGKIFGFSPMMLTFMGFGVVLVVGICWGIVEDVIGRYHGRNWPTAPAIIDLVSVAFIKDNALSPKADLADFSYKATLTYSYNSPDQQIGEYSRTFSDEEEAQAWVNSYKGETVNVHVDPRDPTRSVLREEDL